jgi:tRNA(His) 5'-end guanylyltransferase
MGTLLAGFVSVTFYKAFEKFHPLGQYVPHFDCRIFQVQDMNALRANIVDRVKYTLKNARMMFAQYHLSPKRLIKDKCSSAEAVELVHAEKGINFYETVDVGVRLGTVITYVQVESEKTVIANGAEKVIRYTRNEIREQNLSPREIADLIIC